MCFWQVFVVGFILFKKVGDGIEVEFIYVYIGLEINYFEDFILYCWIVKVQIGLMVVEVVLVVGLCLIVLGLVGFFKILENDLDIFVLVGGFVLDVVVVFRVVCWCFLCLLKLGVLIGSVVDDQFCDYFQFVFMGFIQQGFELLDGIVVGIDGVII